MTYCIVFISKSDEKTEAESLGFILPSHEYFHQSMVIADCESELVRDGSRGLEGGAFFEATILNRKEAKVGKGKDAIDPIKDFLQIKSDARFCQYFVKKYDLDLDKDNSPEHLRSASDEVKKAYLHTKVQEVLRDLLPQFRNSSFEDPQLLDHPLEGGRRPKYQPARENTRKETMLEPPTQIGQEVLERTVEQVQNSLPGSDVVEQNMEELSVVLSGNRSTDVFRCKICAYQSRYRLVCLTHVGRCLVLDQQSSRQPDDLAEASFNPQTSSSHPALEEPEEENDKIDDAFYNYKNAEFFLDAIFSLNCMFEKYGDGLGCYIINKILLPIIHGLRHSNYSCSIHRMITRVLCEATPKEALKLIWERFSNKQGKPGNNVPRDRRMEYRIGTAKKLISNLGPNFTQESVQQVNRTLDVKEELFLKTRVSHGVNIRSGRHNARSDAQDYDMLFSHLNETRAHMKVEGRKFGDYKFDENLMDDKRFNKVEFYRWIVDKNKEAKKAMNAKKGRKP